MGKNREEYGKSTYDLDELQGFVDKYKYDITKTCVNEFTQLDYSYEKVLTIIGNLKKSEIYKTMESKIPDLMQDVYHTRDERNDLYIKLQRSVCGTRCVIVQFKLK